jgi:hypothetical protein
VATRLYYSGYSPSVSPAFSAEWDRTAAGVRRTLELKKASNINAESGAVEAVTTAPYDVILRQFCCPPLKGAQTISGFVKGQMRARESDPSCDMSRAVSIRVVSNDGLTERGILLSDFQSSLTSEFDTTQTDRSFPPNSALTPLACQDGDRIVVEIGYRAFNTVGGNLYGYVWFNNSSATDDLPEDETTTDNLCPWIEFSQDIVFASVQANQVQAQIEYQLPGLLRANQLIAQVEYTLVPPQLNVQQIIAQVEYDPTRFGSGAASLPVLTATGVGRSQSRCHVVPALGPARCQSFTMCPGCSGGNPSHAGSLTKLPDIPLAHGEGTFLVL